MTIYAFAGEDILQIWERGLTQHPLDRALTLLRLIFPDQPRQALAMLSIGQRDGYLLDLYEYAFGPQVAVQANCPACQHKVEVHFNTYDIRVRPDEEDVGAPFTMTSAGYALTFRLPNSFDLATIVQQADPDKARRGLIEQCLLGAIYNGDTLQVADLPDDAIALLATQMATHDPQADIDLALTCPACAQAWSLLFDIVTFLWVKLDAQARRLLGEVNLLAQAYSWREADILGLSPARRQFYLEMVSA